MTTPTVQPEFLGYRVEVVNEGHVAYRLHGPRGATYRLVRSAGEPTRLFLLRSDRIAPVRIMGTDRFTDRNGRLERMTR